MKKPELSLIPIEALEACADAFSDGSRKYGRNSFTMMNDAQWTDCIDSLLRHVHAFASGEDVASDSRVFHLGHAMARCAMLIYWQQHSIGIDNRRTQQPPLEKSPPPLPSCLFPTDASELMWDSSTSVVLCNK